MVATCETYLVPKVGFTCVTLGGREARRGPSVLLLVSSLNSKKERRRKGLEGLDFGLL